MNAKELLNLMKCPSCDNKFLLFDEFTLENFDIKLYRCEDCGLELNLYFKNDEVVPEMSFIATYDGDILLRLN